MRDVAVIGVGQTKFGELWDRSFRSLITEAGLAAARDARVKGEDIEAMFVGSMSAGRFIGQEHVGALVVEEAGLAGAHVPATRVEAADASGAAALRAGWLAVASGAHDVVVVGGVEKMTDVDDAEESDISNAALDREWEAFFGATLASVYALMAKSHMRAFGTTIEQLADVSVKNHENGALNPNAAYPFAVTREQIARSPQLAEPLRMLHAAASVDGAAALILAPLERAASFGGKPVKVLASAQASDHFQIADRASLTEMAATRVAGERAFKQAKLKPRDVSVAEVHDAFAIGEVLAVEDLGFMAKGQGGFGVAKKITTRDGERPVNPSGGLKARGHAPGATGIAQAIEVVHQLRGDAGKRQVRAAKIGLAHNVGGSGATAFVHIFGRGW
ncbi:MAG: thiolase domain-containing protein [Thermoplasmatota archaeon]